MMLGRVTPGEEVEADGACWTSWRYLPFCWRCRLDWGAGSRRAQEVVPADGPAGSPPASGSRPRRPRFRLVCTQRRACSWPGLCCWVLVVVVAALSAFSLAVFWTCMTLPRFRLRSAAEASSGAPVSGQSRRSLTQVGVLSLNMFLRSDGITDEATAAENDFKKERLEYFISYVMSDYDILLLQETWSVNDAGRKKRLVEAAREKGFVYYSRSRCAYGGVMDAMLLILSRHPLVSTNEHTFSKAIGIDAYAAKGILHARALLHGEEACAVDLYSTHLQAGGGDEGARVRSAQTIEVAQFVDAQRRESGKILPAVVGGDFNINGRSSDQNGTINLRYQEMLRDLSLDEGGRLEVLFPRNITNVRRVLPVTSPKRRSKGTSKLQDQDSTQGTCLDYAFFSSGEDSTVAAGAARVNPLFAARGGSESGASEYPFLTVSDHYAVEFNLTCNLT